MSPETHAKCLGKSCDRDASTRGVCPRCYSKMYYYVKIGFVTWDRMHAEGKILPPRTVERG